MAKKAPFQKKRRKRKQKPNPASRIFVGSPLPYNKHNQIVAAEGQLRFHGFEYPFLDGEQRKPRVWIAYMTLGEHQLILGYVWKQTGSQYWKARQPSSPWRGEFASREAAAKALRAAWVPEPYGDKVPKQKSGQGKGMRAKRKGHILRPARTGGNS